jgi:hypothetical protein
MAKDDTNPVKAARSPHRFIALPRRELGALLALQVGQAIDTPLAAPFAERKRTKVVCLLCRHGFRSSLLLFHNSPLPVLPRVCSRRLPFKAIAVLDKLKSPKGLNGPTACLYSGLLPLSVFETAQSSCYLALRAPSGCVWGRLSEAAKQGPNQHKK